MKKITFSALIIVLPLFLCSCSNSHNSGEMKKSQSLWNTTWYEDGMLYDYNTDDGDIVLCYYSTGTDKSVVMCGMPECTHSSKKSPDCGALAEEGSIGGRLGLNIIGNKLYYIISTQPSGDSIGEIRLMESDVDGKNRQVIASVENLALPVIKDIQYFDDFVLLTYFQNSDIKKNEETGEFDVIELEKSRFYIQKMEFTGKTETLVYREGYSATGSGTIYGNVLYYNYTYTLEPSTGESLTLETAPTRYRDFYILDLSTGEEKRYENFMACGLTFGYFSPEKIIGYDCEQEKLGRFYPESEEFAVIGDYNNGYIEDDKEALFTEGEDLEYWTKYNFESGEITHIPVPDDNLGIYLNGVAVVGDMVWFSINSEDSNDLEDAYINRHDFFNGEFNNYKIANKVDA